MTARRTYWHLEGLGRKPSDYDVVTSRLLYYVERGFEVHVPVEGWYAKHQTGSPLRCSDWERFRDPRETTYSRYVEVQQAKEIFVDGLFRSVEATDHDRRLPAPWVSVLQRVLPPARYPFHGLQMASAYVGSMAPCGRIVVAAAFQAADQMRRVQRLAYRMRMLQDLRADFGADAMALWTGDALWQPLREVVERCLVAWDWGEAFTALDLVLLPALDAWLFEHVAALAARCGDSVAAKLFFSLGEDGAWHRDWSRALVRTAIEDRPENAAVLAAWVDRWRAPVDRAVEALCAVFDAPGLPPGPGSADVASAVARSGRDHVAACGLRGDVSWKPA